MTPLLSTQALVLHTTAYAETSVIAKLFTRQLGVRSYILKGVRKSGSRTKQNLLQPLSHLDLVVYDNPKSSLNYIKEISMHGQPAGCQDAVACALRFFMTELLYKSLREAEPQPDLFDYVAGADMHSVHLPITFVLTTARCLGIEPLDNYSLREPYFDLSDGRFVSSGEWVIDRAPSQLLHYYLQALQGEPCPLTTLAQRTALLNCLLDYYRVHIPDFKNFHSHEILHTILQ